MTKNKLLSTDFTDQESLREQIQISKEELEKIEREISAFEAVLYARISDLIVEEQELFVLYKQIKKAKKANRLEQKKRGKNYKETKGLQVVLEEKKSVPPTEQQQEKKRLYREALLHVHPDKFSMNAQATEVATEMTIRLIEIYKTESLETLQAYHAHIFKGNTGVKLDHTAAKITVSQKDDYLEQEKERIEKAVVLAKKDHLYKVMTEYENPLDFVDELKAYYEDRIFKLRKRTRKGL